MHAKTLLSLSCLIGIFTNGEHARAEIRLTAVVNTTDPYLVEHGLISATVSVEGMHGGLPLIGFRGTPEHPWTITLTNGPFFNVDSDLVPGRVPFDGMGAYAATSVWAPNQPGADFDSGVMATNRFPGLPLSAPFSIGFAQFEVGSNSGPDTNVEWLNFDPMSFVWNPCELFRLTWNPDDTSGGPQVVHIGMLAVAGFSSEILVPLELTIVPAPSGVGAVCMFGLIRSRRRRAS